MEAHGARGRNLLKRLAFALIPLALVLVGIEGGARLFFEAPSLAAGGPLGWTARPGLDAHLVEFGTVPFHVTTNADGLRTSLEPGRSDVERWATFGDSTIFGWGVAEDETPAALLEAAVPGIEVLNAGQPGFSSEQSRRLAEQVVPRYLPDRLLWFQSWHDARPARPDREVLPSERRLLQRLLGRSAAWQHATRPDSKNNPLFAYKALPADGERVPAEHRLDNWTRLVELCAEYDVELVLILMPDEGIGAEYDLSTEMAAFSMDTGTQLLDMHRLPPPAPRSTITVFRDPAHLNARGNALYVQMLLQHGL